jgi:hypothetical protein
MTPHVLASRTTYKWGVSEKVTRQRKDGASGNSEVSTCH